MLSRVWGFFTFSCGNRKKEKNKETKKQTKKQRKKENEQIDR